MKSIDIEKLEQGLPTLTPVAGSFYAEASIYCLMTENHHSGIELLMNEEIKQNFLLEWNKSLTPQMISTYQDEYESVEYGATAIAILLTLELTEYTTVERSRRGPQSGFDYWVGNANNLPFQKKARLEISGIKKGDQKRFKQRVKEKTNQVSKSDSLRIPAYVIIVEFSNPKACFKII